MTQHCFLDVHVSKAEAPKAVLNAFGESLSTTYQ
jgi:hypothetical protein